ncbi:MAG: tyrosine-type recombinase/integrase [Solirubrobacteraceae bacterium]
MSTSDSTSTTVDAPAPKARPASSRMVRTKHAGIYRRGSRYVVVWVHRGKQHKSFHPTLAEAREAKGQRASGDTKPGNREPFETYARDWLGSYQGRTSRGFTERSRAAYLSALELHAFPFFARDRVGDVEPRDVKRFVKHLQDRGLAPASVKRTLVPVQAMYADAFEDGDVRANPTAGLRINRHRDEREGEEEQAKALTRAELARLLAAMPDDRRPLFEFLAQTGLRVSEAIGLEWRDVTFGGAPSVRVERQSYRGEVSQLKTRGSRRTVPLAPGTARGLWTASVGRAPTDRVFTSATGCALSDGNVRRRWLHPAAVAAGLVDAEGVPWIGFHTFRHTCASLLFEHGRNIKQVAGWLGHSDPAFTLRTYVHLMDEGIGDAAFLDVVAGNGWATNHPEAAANAQGPGGAEAAA